MKKFSFLLSLLTVLGLYSCSQEDAFLEGTPSKGLTAGIPAYQFDSETRLGISENLHSFTWSDGDQIGIYGEGQYGNEGNAAFTIKNGGSNSGVFTNDIFALKPNSTYYAFYPYDSDATIDSYPVDFTGQIQTKNGGTEHIGARNYMSAEVNTDNSGAANIAFQNLASVIQLQLPIEEAGTYTGVTLSTADADFITQGILKMKTGTISAKTRSQQVKVSFGGGISLNKGDILTVNVLVAPVDFTGKSFSIILETGAKTYSFKELEGKNIQKGKAYKVDCESGVVEETPYLTFTAEAVQTLTMNRPKETLEYSVDNGAWQTLGTNTVAFGGAKGNLRLRGKSSKGTANSHGDYSKISFGNAAKVACSGDIRTLVDYENYKATNTKYARFCRLFEGCSSLTSAPSLPAETLAGGCYYSMFEGCTSLTSAPSLPATTLAGYCYFQMFSGCSSLTSAPSLPATTLAELCCYSMFQGCSSLTSAPSSLPATTLAGYCYFHMFSGCSSLTSAPSLPATTLASGCYGGMFQGCSSLTSAPSLPAETLAVSCYSGMFSGCSSLTSAPSLPATTLASYCYYYMFSGCSNLTSAPSLPATTLADYCYYSMFEGCSSLTSAPSLPATTLAYNCYSYMFSGCSKLNYIKMMATDISATDCLSDWTYRVASTGTFIKSKDATWDVSGSSGIPTGWTVQTE